MNLISTPDSSLRVLASSWEVADSLRSLESGCLIHISSLLTSRVTMETSFHPFL